MKISIVGCGEVGRCYARAFDKAGFTVSVLCDERPSEATNTLAETLGARQEAALGAWLADADLVISAVFGGVSLEVASQALPHMKRGALYADLTTADPDHMRAAAELAKADGIRFVDVAITGAIVMSGAATPLLCAGEGADSVAQLLTQTGAPIKVVGTQAGDAATLKLLRSIFTKGVEALAVECLVAAEKKGLRSELYDVLSDIDQASLTQFLESCVRSHVVHAARRLAEVREAKRQLRKDSLDPLVLDGVESLFERTAMALERDNPTVQNTIEASLAWLGEQAKTKS